MLHNDKSAHVRLKSSATVKISAGILTKSLNETSGNKLVMRDFSALKTETIICNESSRPSVANNA